MSLENAIQDHAKAILELAAAIRAAAGGVSVAVSNEPPVKTGKDKPAAAPKEDDDNGAEGDEGPYLWANLKKGTHGDAGSKAKYEALKKKDKDIIRVTETKYAELVKAAESPEEEEEEGNDAPKATKEELVKAAQAYLPKTLDDETKATRRGFVAKLLTRFDGAEKITEVAEEHWGLLVNLLQRHMAGQKINPSKDGYVAFEEEEEDSQI